MSHFSRLIIGFNFTELGDGFLPPPLSPHQRTEKLLSAQNGKHQQILAFCQEARYIDWTEASPAPAAVLYKFRTNKGATKAVRLNKQNKSFQQKC